MELIDKVIEIVATLSPCCICDGENCFYCGTVQRTERKTEAMNELREYKRIIEKEKSKEKKHGHDGV